MIVLVDNYDSFVHNLARYLRELGWSTEVVRNDAASVDEVAALQPGAVVISPGPGTPQDAGISVPLVARLHAGVPILGICLGHQCIASAFGGRVVRARRPMHGKASPIRHDGRAEFAELPNPLAATRYHSLVVAPDGLPHELEASAWSEEGEIMALRHRERRVVGLQFHPESILTERGHDLLEAVLGPAPAGMSSAPAAAQPSFR